MTTALATRVPDTTIPADVFFELVDEVVIVDAGREPLDGGDPHRRIITVRPNDRVLQILSVLALQPVDGTDINLTSAFKN